MKKVVQLLAIMLMTSLAAHAKDMVILQLINRSSRSIQLMIKDEKINMKAHQSGKTEIKPKATFYKKISTDIKNFSICETKEPTKNKFGHVIRENSLMCNISIKPSGKNKNKMFIWTGNKKNPVHPESKKHKAANINNISRKDMIEDITISSRDMLS